jgi:O-6-methylguanine DNA methyltransferase
MKNFKEKVWLACSRVPRGRVTTYAEIARAIHAPRAARAVGNALNASPGMPRVPCHRVVKASGELGGFASGSAEKKKLLEREGVRVANDKITEFRKKFYHLH